MVQKLSQGETKKRKFSLVMICLMGLDISLTSHTILLPVLPFQDPIKHFLKIPHLEQSLMFSSSSGQNQLRHFKGRAEGRTFSLFHSFFLALAVGCLWADKLHLMGPIGRSMPHHLYSPKVPPPVKGL